MRTARRFLVGTVTLVLLGGLGTAVAAQEQGDEASRAAAFEAEYGEPADIVRDPETGLQDIIDVPVEATDPRASGLLRLTRATGGVCGEDQRLIEDAAEVGGCPAPSYNVDRNGMLIENDGGAWVGTRTHFGGFEADERTRQQKRKGKGHAPFAHQGDLFELTGQGGYEGLTMLGSLDTRRIVGIIVPTVSLPDQPQPPSPEPAAE